jgi:hypothetical protein
MALHLLIFLALEVAPAMSAMTDDTRAVPALALASATPEPTRKPILEPTHRPTHRPFPKPTSRPVPSPTNPFPTRPPHPFPSHFPTLLPTLFEDIPIYTPVAGTYNYALEVIISWKTQGSAIGDCKFINVELYQSMNDHFSFVAYIYKGYPNGKAVSKCCSFSFPPFSRTPPLENTS